MNFQTKTKINTSKILSTVLASTVSLSLLSTTAMATDFSDVNDAHWGLPYVTDAAELGLVGGYEDGSFKPDQSVTVGEFLVMLVNSYPELKTFAVGEGAESAYDHWASEYAYAAKEATLFHTNMNVTPDFLSSTITREQVAFFLYGAMTKVGEESNDGKIFPTDNIKDYSKINSTYNKAVTEVYLFGIMSGKDKDSYGFSTFEPQASLTRAEATVVLLNLNYEDRREPASTDPLSVLTGVQYNENGNQIIQEGLKIKRPQAVEGDIVVKEDGTEVVLVVGPSGVLGEGQGVAADLGLQWEKGGGVINNGSGNFDGALNSVGVPIGNAIYWVNQITGEGHWSNEWGLFGGYPTYEGTSMGSLSDDMNWYWVSTASVWQSVVSQTFTDAQLAQLKADNGLT